MDLEINTDNLKPYYQIGVYAITINPSDKLQNRSSPELERIRFLREYISEILKNIRHKLYWDVSTPIECKQNMYPRIHFHGVMYLESQRCVRELLMEVLPRMSLNNYIKIGPISNLLIWEAYCKKYKNIINYTPLTNKLSFSYLKQIKENNKTTLQKYKDKLNSKTMEP